MLYQEYLTECMKNGTLPELVKIDGSWLRALLAEYRISSRIPNRKFKVTRWILAERL